MSRSNEKEVGRDFAARPLPEWESRNYERQLVRPQAMELLEATLSLYIDVPWNVTSTGRRRPRKAVGP